MKTCKVASIDNIAMEHIQNVNTDLQNELIKLKNDIYIMGEFPEDF